MAVRIRLKRMGRKKRPFYRLVAIDSRKRRDGLEVERLGWYNPVEKDLSCQMNEERILYWLGQGAQPSDTVSGLFRRSGLSYKWDLIKSGADGDKVDSLLSISLNFSLSSLSRFAPFLTKSLYIISVNFFSSLSI